MTVRIEKPAVNVREKLAELDKPTGIAGEAMLRAETPQEQFNLIGAGRRNLLINGDFKVSQRGDFTSAASLPTSHTYHVDRWAGYRFGEDSGTFQHKLDQELPDGSYTNTFRLTSTCADLDTPFYQHIEDNKAVWGREFTLSFWYKSTTEYMYNFWNGTTQIHIPLDNTGGEWKKHINTYKFPQNGTNLRVEYYAHTKIFPSGTFFEIAQVQLELGKVATPFEHRSYGEELALCQRYYEEMDLFGTVTNKVPSYNDHQARVYYKVRKRTTPTLNTPFCGNFQPGGGSGTTSISKETVDSVTVISNSSSGGSWSDQFYNGSTILTIDAEL